LVLPHLRQSSSLLFLFLLEIKKIKKSEKFQDPKKIDSLEELTDNLSQLQLKSVDSDGKFLIPASVTDYNVLLDTLFDSSAGDNFISLEFLQKHNLLHLVRYCSPRSARAAFNEIKIILQTIELSLSVENWKASVSFFVVEDLFEPAIVGLRFMRKHAHLINLRTLTFANVPATTPADLSLSVNTSIKNISVISPK
jgi:hypothetical protein